MDQGPPDSEGGTSRAGEWRFDVHQGQVRLGLCEQRDRLTNAADSRGRRFREASWDEALALVAPASSEIKAQNGPDALAFMSSSKCTNEESYLMQKLARAVIGTNNMDNCSRYCQAPATTGLFRTVGYGGDSGSISDIEQAESGDDHRQQHRGEPSGAGHARQACAQDARAKADRRRPAETRDGAARGYVPHPRPGTDLIWLSAVTRYILDNGLARQEFLDEWVNGLDEYSRVWNRSRIEMPRRGRASDRDAEESCRDDCGGRERVHAVGDGRDAALDGVGHVDGDLEFAAGDRQLQASRRRRLSAARAQQRAGGERAWRDAELSFRATRR